MTIIHIAGDANARVPAQRRGTVRHDSQRGHQRQRCHRLQRGTRSTLIGVWIRFKLNLDSNFL